VTKEKSRDGTQSRVLRGKKSCKAEGLKGHIGPEWRGETEGTRVAKEESRSKEDVGVVSDYYNLWKSALLYARGPVAKEPREK